MASGADAGSKNGQEMHADEKGRTSKMSEVTPYKTQDEELPDSALIDTSISLPERVVLAHEKLKSERRARSKAEEQVKLLTAQHNSDILAGGSLIKTMRDLNEKLLDRNRKDMLQESNLYAQVADLIEDKRVIKNILMKVVTRIREMERLLFVEETLKSEAVKKLREVMTMEMPDERDDMKKEMTRSARQLKEENKLLKKEIASRYLYCEETIERMSAVIQLGIDKRKWMKKQLKSKIREITLLKAGLNSALLSAAE